MMGPWRIGLGPVFAMERLTLSRKWQVYALRALFVSALLTGISMAWAESRVTSAPDRRQLARLGEAIFYAMATVQLALVMLAAPAATAGALCLDKARGTLLHLLATDLSDAEIVLGKLAARLGPAVGLVLSAMPVAALLTLLGGVDPVALTGLFLVTLALTVLGCSLALLLSVWAKKTHEVVMTVYLVWAAWLLALPIGIWLMEVNRAIFGRPVMAAFQVRPDGLLAKSNPVWIVFGPMTGMRPRPIDLADQIVFTVIVLGSAVGCTTLAVLMMRRVTIRQAGRRDASRPGWGLWAKVRDRIRLPHALPGLPAPSLDTNPVLWREWHGNRATGWSRRIWTVYAIASLMASTLVLAAAIIKGKTDEGAAVVNVVQVGVGLLLLSVSASTSLSEERVRGSLDVLMTTPLSTAQIVWGKWLGAYRRVPWLAVLPTLTVTAVALRSWRWPFVPLVAGTVLAQGAAITAFGLLMAAWTHRVGRAVGVTVAAYALIGVGWIFVLAMLFPRGPDAIIPLGMASPLFAQAMMGVAVERRGSDALETFVGGIFWIFAYSAVTVALLAVTWRAFPGWLGRIDRDTLSEVREALPKRPRARFQPKQAAFALEPNEREEIRAQ